MAEFDYQAEAEVFMTGARGGRRPPVTYKRFATAAEAIRYAVEQVAAPLKPGVVLEVDGERYDHAAIRDLYADAQYPLSRAALA